LNCGNKIDGIQRNLCGRQKSKNNAGLTHAVFANQAFNRGKNVNDAHQMTIYQMFFVKKGPNMIVQRFKPVLLGALIFASIRNKVWPHLLIQLIILNSMTSPVRSFIISRRTAKVINTHLANHSSPLNQTLKVRAPCDFGLTEQEFIIVPPKNPTPQSASTVGDVKKESIGCSIRSPSLSPLSFRHPKPPANRYIFKMLMLRTHLF
jgi:hypothetical protein